MTFNRFITDIITDDDSYGVTVRCPIPFINILFRKCMMFEINLLEVKKGFKYSHINAEVTCNYGEWHLTSFNTQSKEIF